MSPCMSSMSFYIQICNVFIRVDDETKKQQYASTMENMIPLEHRLGDQQEVCEM